MSSAQCSPPQYTAQPDPPFRLVSVTPAHNPRYNQPTEPSGTPLETVIRPGRPRITEPIVDDFHQFTHPEGDLYWYSRERSIITSVNVRLPGVRKLLNQVVDYIHARANRDGVRDFNGVEIYLYIPKLSEAQPVEVHYYLVDHRARQLFWLEEVPAPDLGLAPFLTDGMLRSALLPEYWTHLDYFPMHCDVPREAEDELIAILSHGLVDNMTSPGSTCPYSTEECQKYLDTLRGFRDGRPKDAFATRSPFAGYRTACIARLWSAITRARHINNFGSEFARLDRLQGLHQFKSSQSGSSLKLTIFEILTFFLPLSIFERLVALFNCRVVYQRHWQTFFSDMKMLWAQMAGLSVVILIASVLLIAYGHSVTPAAISASLAAAAIFSSLFLHQKHPHWLLSTGPAISEYVMSVEDYYTGLRPLSIIFSIPQTLTIYAAIACQMAITLNVIHHVAHTLLFNATVASCFVGAVPILVVTMFFAPRAPSPPPQSRKRSMMDKIKGVFGA